MSRRVLTATFHVALLVVVLTLSKIVFANDLPHRITGKEYDAARNITTCIYRRLGESSPEKIKRREIKGKVACPGRYVWDDNVQYPDEEGTYILNDREFDSEKDETICIFREVGGTRYKRKVLIGDADCPIVLY